MYILKTAISQLKIVNNNKNNQQKANKLGWLVEKINKIRLAFC